MKVQGCVEKKPKISDNYVLWDVETVMSVLGYKSRSGFYRAVKKLNMPKPIKIGQKARWRKQEVLDWIDSCPKTDYNINQV
ncbi:AlpA family phage regulatory protein [Pasteurella skyensis]|uniref:AlpA family phage regulatory protein n=1 Tax=Phocoenobacter skyensis TaxID=97481 RepID=A0AAJ6NAE8_9PAST|nr:AlpA family phage regulatory protein [Pasteurella skyensis]MDP8173165.1 AlpA family phage regulatory protein [Pasteurella skyensis]MDP8176387.1 AlpA family phage regulatory protein [Pasteurella skyensis]MDP8178902.1 AlpA family phage regulatory protein [Pasteurella skyensis]MDP8199100.1 AlpA family phage regulatory protein [Pasteurella skyensis]